MKKSKLNKALKILLSIFIMFAVIILILLVIFKIFISSMHDDMIDLNLKSAKNSLTSEVYALDSDGVFKEYKRFNNYNRIWVDFSKIPQHMKDAIVAIEDKRFYKHGGIDFIRTVGAFANVIVGKKSYGGSTLTQQLVKNITDDNEVSFSRKIREMARAIRLEEKFSKDEILETYLNIVNFGAGTSGVQSAANIYFNKDIEECSIAECAAIAAITQNPSVYNPLVNPEKNKKRREIIINEMYSQKKISKVEYENSLKESKNLKFLKTKSKENKHTTFIKNWYIETMCKDIINDISSKYKIKKSMAEDILYSGGLKIYSCIDPDAQEIAEQTIMELSPVIRDLELGYMMIGYDGRILAILGSSKKKVANLIYNRAISAKRQPGSVIKPISVYAPAIDYGIFTYSSKIPDEPLKIDFDGSGVLKNWPKNWYKHYKGEVTLQWAVEKSANAPAAQVLNVIGLEKSFKFLTEKLKFSSLDISDSTSFSALAAGGTHIGVTVKEIASAFQIFGNGGKFFNLKTYDYVTDKDGKVLLDNRNNWYIQVINEVPAYIVNRLLLQVVRGDEGTGKMANIKGVEVVGKTGTTTKNYDCWFAGLTATFAAVCLFCNDIPKSIYDTTISIKFWERVGVKYNAKKYKENSVLKHEFSRPSNGLLIIPFCPQTGLLANENCPIKKTGYYSNLNVPSFCHAHGGQRQEEIFTIDEPVEEQTNESQVLEDSVEVPLPVEEESEVN
ncbi:MAG: transglycosylase domain-containing protein [Firmicutes bacterium]|nr:transglycosylase domain-containing protein [Bacillota bacterium]